MDIAASVSAVQDTLAMGRVAYASLTAEINSTDGGKPYVLFQADPYVWFVEPEDQTLGPWHVVAEHDGEWVIARNADLFGALADLKDHFADLVTAFLRSVAPFQQESIVA